MGIQDWLAIGLATAGALYVVRFIRRSMKGETGCGSGGPCSKVSAHSSAASRPKRLPLVTLDQIGKPASPDATRKPPDD